MQAHFELPGNVYEKIMSRFVFPFLDFRKRRRGNTYPFREVLLGKVHGFPDQLQPVAECRMFCHLFLPYCSTLYTNMGKNGTFFELLPEKRPVSLGL